MKIPTAILIGAGSRGREVYAEYAYRTGKLKIVAVGEPNYERRNYVANRLSIPKNLAFEDWRELLTLGKIADGAIIATKDDLHVEPAIEFMKLGYDLLLEKPMDRTLAGAVEITKASKKYGRRVIVAHVLRYTKFFQKIKELLDSNVIGEVVGINHIENVGFWHVAHSYVRGNWRRTDETAPMILTKSCHDMDILYWLIGRKCDKIASFGSLSHFKKENKPADAGSRCLECPVEQECPYSAVKLYLNENQGWPQNVISDDLSIEGRIKALKEGPYGRCVYECDNDVVDHQVAILSFRDLTVTFTMQGFTNEIDRRIRIFGTKGEINGRFNKGEIEILLFGKDRILIDIKNDIFAIFEGHGGGDIRMLDEFAKMLSDTNYNELSTSAEDSLESHIMAWAAEQSRITNSVVDMNEFRRKNFVIEEATGI